MGNGAKISRNPLKKNAELKKKGTAKIQFWTNLDGLAFCSGISDPKSATGVVTASETSALKKRSMSHAFYCEETYLIFQI
jgi:hypothetical protein